MKKILGLIVLFCLACVFLSPVVSAAPPTSYPANFTPIFNKTTENVHYNVTYRWNDNATTPFENLYFYAICAVVLSVVGYRWRCEFCTILAIVFSSMAIYASYAVDFTSYGVTSTVNVESTPNVYNYVAMSLHEVTPLPNMMIAMSAICIMSVINLYRLYVWYRATEMEEVGGRGGHKIV